MNDVEDNLLADYDLSAWEVPPPAAGLADRVVRRVREPSPHAVATPRSLRPWIIGAGSLAALVAILSMVLWGIERAPADGSGVVAATGPRTLDLGRSSAIIDSGAQLTWSRRGGTVAVSQSRGGATWRVWGDDTLVIDAAVASIEATGASLRVEVEMNRSDVRAMGVGSAAAVIVSLVTVIVYEGHVKATSNGQTVNIQPGASMQFGAQPPPAPDPVPPEQLNVGGSPEDEARIRELEAEVARLERELAARDKKDSKDPKDSKDTKDTKVTSKTTCDEVSCVLTNYDGACCAKYKKACDPEPFIEKGDTFLLSGKEAAALEQFEAALRCKPELATTKKAFMAACRTKQKAKAQAYYLDLPADQRTNYVQICLRNGIALDEKACDADALKKKGDDYLGNGMDIAALAQFEASLRCKYDSGVVKTAFLAACRSKQEAKAKLYFAKLPPNLASNYVQICERFGIFLDGSSPSTGLGQLRISARPANAKIQIDGKDLGTAPLSTELQAGKHKVTFIVGENKYTYSVVIKPGEVTTLRKDLPVDGDP